MGHGYPTRDGPGAHDVFLEAKLLRALCRPVSIPKPGLTAKEVAGLLGRCAEDLYPTRSRGKFAARHIEGLGGHWGRPAPILSHKGELDPSMTGLEMPDPVWGWTAEFQETWVRDAFEQRLERVPVHLDRTKAFDDKSALHPEHPSVDGPTKRYRYPLPKPEPDAIPYKWKDGKFVGYDWKAARYAPRIRENYERHERRKARARELWKERALRGNKLRESKARGSEQFRGWRWVCPSCGKQVKTVYLPMAFVNVLDGLMSEAMEREVDARRPAPPARKIGGFACKKCYRVRFFAPSNHAYWNAVIGYLTGGLMYGWEVEKPAWVSPKRKRAYRPRIDTRGAWQRERVRELLERGWKYADIAKELKTSMAAVYVHSSRIFKMDGARGRKDWERRRRSGRVGDVKKRDEAGVGGCVSV